jgi:DNA adenine methylase
MNPVVQWLGGKRRLLPVLKSKLPTEYGRYFEIFLGGGALLLALEPKNAVCIEKNIHLYSVYVHIRDNPADLITQLSKLSASYLNLPSKNERKAFYLEVRRKFNEGQNGSLDKTVDFLFLNKTCFNAVYRENKSGKFNVPFGNGKDCVICPTDSIRQLSAYLQHVTLIHGDFEQVRGMVQAGDFIYMDPPYYPAKNKSIPRYNSSGFTMDDQERVIKLFKDLDQQGVKIMLSNSNVEYIKTQLESYNISEVSIARTMSCDKTKRSKSKCELIVTNY